MIGVYVHVPYCRTLCPYCDFYSRDIPGDVPPAFIDALRQEICLFPSSARVATVFFGGGTPSLLDQTALKQILQALDKKFKVAADAEISIEANPDDITPALAAMWRRVGINRVSIGVQSFDDDTLRYLGRRHDAAAAVRACETVAADFDNWSVDLIFGAKPVEAWTATLEQCRQFRPKHVSAYGLTYEPETPFGRRAHESVDDETWVRLYRESAACLSDYNHYEISNYALAGYECRHNLVYWHNEEYAGFGPGAYSFIDGVRARNPADVERYGADPGLKEELLYLTEREIRVETLLQHFRLKEGIEKDKYRRRFGCDIRPEFAEAVGRSVQRGLLWEDTVRIAPTERGFELNNEIGLDLLG